jgi:retron-type reverse transcriptase
MLSKLEFSKSSRRIAREYARSDFEQYFLEAVINREIDPYMNRKLSPKKNGKTRLIAIPNGHLAKLQRIAFERIEKKISEAKPNRSPISDAAHAYVKGRSTVTAAQTHLGMLWGIKVDIASFFDNVTESQVFRSLRRLGFEKSEALVLTRICTRVPRNWPDGLPPKFTRFNRALTNGEYRLQNELGVSGLELHSWNLQSLPIHKPKSRRWVTWIENSSIWKKINSKSRETFLETYLASEDYREPMPQVVLPKGRQRTKFIYSEMPETAESKPSGLRQSLLMALKDRLKAARYIGSNMNYPVDPAEYRQATREGHLPQGACTSGLLANLVMLAFDNEVENYLRGQALRYTRYSDDIVISTDMASFSRVRALEIISQVQKFAQRYGFTLNNNKTRVITPGSRKFMLGLLVDRDGTHLPREVKDRIENSIRSLAKFGQIEVQANGRHLLNQSHYLPGKNLGIKQNPRYSSDPVLSLRGWLAYANSVDKDFLQVIESRLANGKWDFLNPDHRTELENYCASLLSPSRDRNEKQKRKVDDKETGLTTRNVEFIPIESIIEVDDGENNF